MIYLRASGRDFIIIFPFDNVLLRLFFQRPQVIPASLNKGVDWA